MNIQNSNLYEIWFSSVTLSAAVKKSIITNFESLEEIWIYAMSDSVSFTNSRIKRSLKEAWKEEELKIIYQKISSNHISVISYYDDEYPTRLKNYDDAPVVLYYKGDIRKLNQHKSAAIVGSRACTYYGKSVTKYISSELSKKNISIISGMAKGIDSEAHKECLNNQGFTCAVLGSGVDVIYPSENKQLYEHIEDTGCIISEFLPGSKPLSYNFPIRNRIISELSDLIIVVEAGAKSGSLITANLAIDQGKDVIVVPGPIFSEQSKGTNKLIQDGACPFVDIQDVFRLLNEKFLSGQSFQEKGKYSSTERQIMDIICNFPIHIDEIIKSTDIDIERLYNVLFELQLKNEIMCLAGNYYVKNNYDNKKCNV